VGRVIKVALSDPRVIDVNDVKSLMLEPGKYLVFLQVEVDPNTRVRELEDIRHYIENVVKSTTDRVDKVIIEFTGPKEPVKSFTSLLEEVVKLPEEA
ncbi:MAG: cation transporter dimerization domain-containing protein, partial [Sulfolobales archaeon]